MTPANRHSGYLDHMLELVPESREALAEMVKLEDPQLDDELLEMGQLARSLVPDLVGLSLTVVSEGVTFTLVAPNSAVAALDATQYLDGGPCVDVVTDPAHTIETRIDELMDEDRWTVFARSSAAAGVASTLSMSITDGHGHVTGGLNFYASTPDAFTGRHEALADALGGSAESVISNADLGFSTLEKARQAPVVLRDRARIETAVGMLAARYRETIDSARDRLLKAAQRARVDPVVVARVLIFSHLD
jgi:GAF domain-containing protein